MSEINERTFEKKLPVQLTDQEKLQNGVALARALSAVRDEKEKKKDIGAVIKKLTEQADALETALTTGVEERLVEVKEVMDWERKRVTLIRLDTAETIEDRPMKAEEVQKPLNLSPGQSKADSDGGDEKPKAPTKPQRRARGDGEEK